MLLARSRAPAPAHHQEASVVHDCLNALGLVAQEAQLQSARSPPFRLCSVMRETLIAATGGNFKAGTILELLRIKIDN